MKTHKQIEKAEDKLAKSMPAPKRKAFAKVQQEEKKLEGKKKKPRGY